MTSLFEFAEMQGTGEIPIDLISCGGRDVSLLEFFAVEEEAIRLEREREARAAERTPEAIAHENARLTRVMVDAARAEALLEARRGFEEELAQRLGEERARITRVCGEFAMDRQKYFAAAEVQVVKLAIAIARRVLAKEVAADKMHLTATVRAALSRVHDGSATILRVRASEESKWAEMFGSAGDGSVTVVGDDRLGAGECVLETDVGRVELGVEVQIAEIERGFGDLIRRQGE